jgi:hypothetical protein
MIVVPFKAEHLLGMQLQRSQSGSKPFITEEYARMLEGQFAFTALDDDGEVVAVGGLAELWEQRALAWSFIDSRAGKHFVALHKLVRDFLDMAPYRRIEAETSCGFGPGHRWLKMLGFQMEAERMRAFQVDGGDSALYARVKHG